MIRVSLAFASRWREEWIVAQDMVNHPKRGREDEPIEQGYGAQQRTIELFLSSFGVEILNECLGSMAAAQNAAVHSETLGDA